MVKTWTDKDWLKASSTEHRIRFGSDGNGVFAALNLAGITGNRAQSWVLFDSVEMCRIFPGEVQAWVKQGLFLEADLIAAARWTGAVDDGGQLAEVDRLWKPVTTCDCPARFTQAHRNGSTAQAVVILSTLNLCRNCGGGVAK